MQMGDVEQYRVVDSTRKVGTWLKVGERDANLDIVVKQHDATNETLTVERGGQTMTLAMKAAKVLSGGNAATLMPPPLPPPPGTNVSPAVIQTVVPNPSPQQEQARLEAVAAEVARRRALREQAYQQTQQNQGAAAVGPNATRADMQPFSPPVPPVQRPNRNGR
jgi:hypothetical protein